MIEWNIVAGLQLPHFDVFVLKTFDGNHHESSALDGLTL